VRILLIEDDPHIASFILTGFRDGGFTADHAEDGEKGLGMALETTYDAAVIDLMLPKMDGLRLIEEIRKRKNTMPIIILSAKSAVDDRIKGLQTGSDDYLTKPFSFSELFARVQALIRRSKGISEPTSLAYADLHMNLITREVRRGEKPILLQPLEFSLLEYLMRNAEKVVSRRVIMEQVWDYHFDPETNVVEARICRLRDKIDKEAHLRLIHTIRGAGYVLKKSS
jgi:DNA-binding response OmpR family regulator